MMNETQNATHISPVAQCIFNYKEESQQARRNRETKNRENWECYHLRQDYSHKKRGQSKEFLAKQATATEQITAFLQQGLMDLGDWFRIETQPGIDPQEAKIKPKEMEKLLLRQLEKNSLPNFMADAIKMGLLNALMIVKVSGKRVCVPKFEARSSSSALDTRRKVLVRKDKYYWQLLLSLVRAEDYFPDPTGSGLYELQRIEMDWDDLYEIAKAHPEDYDMDAVERASFSVDELQGMKKARETGQNVTYSQFRRRVTIWECWGDIIEQGTGKVLHRDCVTRVDTQGNEISPPKANPLWHGGSPFVVSPIIRVPLSIWHKALMDAGTRHNLAMNEQFNLMTDAAMMATHGIKQLRSHWLENPEQVSDGIPPGETLLANQSCPPGQKVLERVDTSSLPPEAVNMYNLVDREFQQSSFSNDTRMGSLPQRAVKATEIVASNQAITGVFNGIVKVIEEEFVSRLLDKSWLTMAQHMNDLDEDEVKAILGEDRGLFIANLTNEELFADTALGHKYKVFGLSTTLNKIQDFRKISTLLQSIGASPQMMQEFMRKYSMTKLLGEIIKSLDIDETKIEMSPEEAQQHAQEQAQAQAMQMAEIQAKGQGNTQGGRGTNPQSQIPQAANQSDETNPVAIPRGAQNIGMTHPG